MKTKAWWICLFLLFAITACSRPAKLKQAPAKAAADATLLLAQNLEQKKRYLDSSQSFSSALSQYRSFADLRGELYALSGLARLAYRQDQQAEFEQYHKRMQYLTRHGDQTGHYVLLVLDLFCLQQEKRYTEIQSLAQDSYDYPLAIRMQILSYKLQADSFLNPGKNSTSYEDLKRLSNRYRRQLKKDFSADPTVLSSALYAMAYHNYLAQDYTTAQKQLDEVVKLDSLYENHSGLGYAHWLRGMVHESRQDKRQAITDYICAKNVFQHFANVTMIRKVEAALTRLEVVNHEYER